MLLKPFLEAGKAMIIINLRGGLGNQLFQYALGRKLAIVNDVTLKIDIGRLEVSKNSVSQPRSFLLEEFNIKAELASQEEIFSLKYQFTITRLADWFKFNILRQRNLVFNQEIIRVRPDVYLDGFWQSPRYFSDIRQYLLSELIPKNIEIMRAHSLYRLLEKTNSVSIHIRRGDYISNEKVKRRFGPCSLSYYINSIQKIMELINNPIFLIFSDDVSWVKENLPRLGQYHYVNDFMKDDIEQFWLMSCCKHNIISNSTYSWWAAWLNVNKNKVVISPTPWFNHISYDSALVLPEWIKLSK